MPSGVWRRLCGCNGSGQIERLSLLRISCALHNRSFLIKGVLAALAVVLLFFGDYLQAERIRTVLEKAGVLTVSSFFCSPC